MSTLRTIRAELLDVIAPPHCLCCRSPLLRAPAGPALCTGCIAAIERSPGRLLRADALDGSFAAARLRGRRPAARHGAEVRAPPRRRRARCGADRRAGAGRLARGDDRPGAGIAGTGAPARLRPGLGDRRGADPPDRRRCRSGAAPARPAAAAGRDAEPPARPPSPDRRRGDGSGRGPARRRRRHDRRDRRCLRAGPSRRRRKAGQRGRDRGGAPPLRLCRFGTRPIG